MNRPVVRIVDLTPAQRRLILALLAAKAAEAQARARSRAA